VRGAWGWMMEVGTDMMGVRGNNLRERLGKLESRNERSCSTNRDDVEMRRAHNKFHNV
jgi:hypothetical protein